MITRMEKECDIVKDLLFSYNDGVLRETSKEFVEEHLKNCESCKKDLAEIKKEEENKEEAKEIDAFKKIRKKMTKKNIIISIFLILIVAIFIFLIVAYKKYDDLATSATIMLQADIAEEQIENIKNAITEVSEDVEINYISETDALKDLQDWLGDDANVLEPYANEEAENPFLPSLEVKANTKQEIQLIVKNLQEMEGVENITSYLNWSSYEILLWHYFLRYDFNSVL